MFDLRSIPPGLLLSSPPSKHRGGYSSTRSEYDVDPISKKERLAVESGGGDTDWRWLIRNPEPRVSPPSPSQVQGVRLCDPPAGKGTIVKYNVAKGYGVVRARDGTEWGFRHSEVPPHPFPRTAGHGGTWIPGLGPFLPVFFQCVARICCFPFLVPTIKKTCPENDAIFLKDTFSTPASGPGSYYCVMVDQGLSDCHRSKNWATKLA